MFRAAGRLQGCWHSLAIVPRRSFAQRRNHDGAFAWANITLQMNDLLPGAQKQFNQRGRVRFVRDPAASRAGEKGHCCRARATS